MAKKQVGTKKATEATTKSSTARDEQATPPRAPAAAKTTSALPLPLLFICMIVPLVSMITSNEAPRRPFVLLDPTKTTTSAGFGSTQQPAMTDPRILLVTAHPDDEILFAPTILSLLSEEHREHADLWALTLSTGNYVLPGANLTAQAQSEVRRAEWDNSWDVLGLSKDRRWILDVESLRDNPEAEWDAQVITEQVLPFIWEHNINTILTFDDAGITKHPNHRSIPGGITRLLSNLPDLEVPDSISRPAPTLYTLKTSPALSQYGPLTPVIEHLYLGVSVVWREIRAEYGKDKASVLAEPRTIVFISNHKRYFQTWKALLKHQSQINPVTLAMAAFGKYVWVNEWVEII